MVITDRDKEEWARHPVTMQFVTAMTDSRQETLEAWAAEAFTSDTAEKAMQLNATALGGIRVLDDLLSVIEIWKNLSTNSEVTE